MKTPSLWYIVSLCFRLPQSVEIAVFVGGDDGFGDGKVGFGLVVGGEVFLLEAGLVFQDDPLDVMCGEHGVLHGADLDSDVVPVLLDLGDVLFLRGVHGVGDEFLLIGLGRCGGKDLIVLFVEVHGFTPLLRHWFSCFR